MSNKSSGQIWRGTVTRVLDDGLVWVLVPQLMGTEQLGPMPAHGNPTVGLPVLIVLLGGSRQDMIAVPDYEARLQGIESRLTALEP